MLNSRSEINTIQLTFIQELVFPIQLLNVGAQNIDNTILNIFEIIFAIFLNDDKVNQVNFFDKIFLIANISLK